MTPTTRLPVMTTERKIGDSGSTRAEPEYTREEMREACLNNYNAGLLHAMEVVLKCPDETPPVEMFRAIQAELKQR